MAGGAETASAVAGEPAVECVVTRAGGAAASGPAGTAGVATGEGQKDDAAAVGPVVAGEYTAAMEDAAAVAVPREALAGAVEAATAE